MVEDDEDQLVLETLLQEKRICQVRWGHLEEVCECLASHGSEYQPLQSHLLPLVDGSADVSDFNRLKGASEQRGLQIVRGLEIGVRREV